MIYILRLSQLQKYVKQTKQFPLADEFLATNLINVGLICTSFLFNIAIVLCGHTKLINSVNPPS